MKTSSISKIPQLSIPLADDFSVANGSDAISVDGPHRFLKIGNVVGYQPTSLKTICRISTELHLNNEGTIILWIAPLETITTAALIEAFVSKDPNCREYGILSDAFPTNDLDESIFAWHSRSYWHPHMVAKFMKGPSSGTHGDCAVNPYVPVEHLPLREKQWYECALTWNIEQSRVLIYVNGILCGTTSYPFQTEKPRPVLFLGNTAMAFANLRIYDQELSAAEVDGEWRKHPFPVSPEATEELAALHTIRPKLKPDWQPDKEWALVTNNSLCEDGSFDGWKQEGCLVPGFEMTDLKTTSEGLLLATPDQVHTELRVYFWSPDSYEGDIAVEFDFKPERRDGLALLVAQASGMQGEDIIDDLPPRTTGSMSTIVSDRVRNYHWEFFRHVPGVRGDIATHVLVKNPWQYPLGLSSQPLLELHQWHRLLFVQEGNHLRAGIDGEWVLDVHDRPDSNNGPVFTRGRIGIRLMFQTRMFFRNLKVWNRERGA